MSLAPIINRYKQGAVQRQQAVPPPSQTQPVQPPAQQPPLNANLAAPQQGFQGPYSPFQGGVGSGGWNPMQMNPWQGQAPGGPWGTPVFNPQERNQYGGQQIAGAKAGPADYGSVQKYSDEAHQAARRYLDPQQATENRRFDQELINKGIDPNSAAGQEAASQLARQQTDANNAASFGALQFGQGIQNQMNQQEFQRSQLAGQMQNNLWNAQLGAGGLGNQRYLGELGNMLGWGQLGSQYQQGMGNLDLARQGQDWNQMIGLEDRNFQYQQYNDMLNRGDQRYQNQILFQLLGMQPTSGGGDMNMGNYFNAIMQGQGMDKGLLGNLFG